MIRRLPTELDHPLSIESIVNGDCYRMQIAFFGFPAGTWERDADRLWVKHGFTHGDPFFRTLFALPGWRPPFRVENDASPHQWMITLVMLNVR